MSRGPGRVQNAVLAVLANQPAGWTSGWLTVAEVSAQVFPPGPVTRAQVESARRALKALERGGDVELDFMEELTRVRRTRVAFGDWQHGRRGHFAGRRTLVAHCRLSVEERESRGQFFAKSLDRLVELDRTGGADR